MRILLVLLLCAILHISPRMSFGAQPIVRFANPHGQSANQTASSPNRAVAEQDSDIDDSSTVRLRSALRRVASGNSQLRAITSGAPPLRIEPASRVSTNPQTQPRQPVLAKPNVVQVLTPMRTTVRDDRPVVLPALPQVQGQPKTQFQSLPRQTENVKNKTQTLDHRERIIRLSVPVTKKNIQTSQPSHSPKSNRRHPTTARAQHSRRQNATATKRPRAERTPNQSDIVTVSHQPEALPSVPPEENRSAAQPEEIFFDLKPIDQISINTRPKDGEIPHDIASDHFARVQRQPHPMGHSRQWYPNTYSWMAPSLAHRPLYFEDINLERYGYHWSVLQPAVSAAHFFARLPVIPYMRGAYPPRQHYFTLGHYRPGSHVPFYLSRLPVSLRGALMEGGAIASGIHIIP